MNSPSVIQLDGALPPCSIPSEQSVLGGIMFANEAWERVNELLAADAFYRFAHRDIYEAICWLIECNKPADALTVAERLKSVGKLEEAGGVSYLISLVESTPGVSNIRSYAETIHEMAILRKLAKFGNEIADSCMHREGRSAADLLNTAESEVLSIAQSVKRERGTFQSITDALSTVMEHLDEQSKHPDKMTGVSTGFVDLDRRTDGLQAGDLIIVAGRPSMGKTSFALNMAENVAINKGLPVFVFSMEMGTTQLATRMLASRAKVDSQDLRRGRLDGRDWDRINAAMAELNGAPIQIDETGALSAMEIRSRARRMYRQYGGCGLIVVDYLQLMRATSEENRATQLGAMSGAMKAMAKELQTPVIALSQLNRGLEQRPNKRPVMSDLRESGAIEQDADVIWFLYRDEVYNPDTQYPGVAEVITAKQRNGPIGTDRLAFLAKFTRFESYAGDYQAGWTAPAPPPPRRRAFAAASAD